MSSRESAAGEPEPPTLELDGREGSVPLGFVREDDTVFLVARRGSARWPIDALRTGVVHLAIGGDRVHGAPRLVPPGAERDAILERFRRKYGEEGYRRWYDRPTRVLAVDLGRGGPSVAPPERYYGWLEGEFDNIAADYDRHILGNRMNRLLRDRSLAVLRPTFAGAHRLLEIGCGSGLETLRLLEAGHEVTAVDISEGMLEVVRRKARTAGLSERLSTVHARAGSVPPDRIGGGPGGFDGGYSTYGAINCEPELAPIRETFAHALRVGAPLVLGVYNRWCLTELLGYGLTFRWSRALGRRRNPVRVGDSRFCVDVFAYSATDIERGFRPAFEPRAIAGVPVVLPPSDLSTYADRFSSHFDRLDRWDAWLGRRAALARWGDHFLITLERRRSAS